MRHPFRAPIAVLVLSTLVLFGAGCATTGDAGPRVDTPILPGSVLVLEEGLMLTADEARVYFQAGRVLRFHDRDRFATWCSIGVRRAPDGELPAAVSPGRFTVTDVRSGARAGLWPPGGVRVAWRMTGLDRGGTLGQLTWTIEMRLDSVEQPRVHDLRCALDRAPDWRGRLGLESVRAALGGLGQLLPPEP
jgi:hypothetical protein